MASAAQTLSDSGCEFEVDGTQRTHTLRTPGGRVSNSGNVDFFINVDGGTVATTQPGGDSNLIVPVGGTVVLPNTARTFTAKATASTYAVFTKG